MLRPGAEQVEGWIPGTSPGMTFSSLALSFVAVLLVSALAGYLFLRAVTRTRAEP